MGVGWLWLVDTDAKQIEVLENVRGKMLPRGDCVDSGALAAAHWRRGRGPREPVLGLTYLKNRVEVAEVVGPGRDAALPSAIG
jgi:hypothetical protein